MNGRRLPAVCALLLLVPALAGCIPAQDDDDRPTPRPTPTASGSATATSTPEPTATQSTEPEPSAEPVGLGCMDVVTLDEMYEFNSNYAAIDYTPQAGSPEAFAVAEAGIACRWVHSSSGVPIDFSVSKPGEQVVGGRSSGFGTAGGIGTMQAGVGPYWVTVSSADLLSEQDASRVLDLVTNGLG